MKASVKFVCVNKNVSLGKRFKKDKDGRFFASDSRTGLRPCEDAQAFDIELRVDQEFAMLPNTLGVVPMALLSWEGDVRDNVVFQTMDEAIADEFVVGQRYIMRFDEAPE